ncbi:unnamed protein product [Strongylus vulgaris]|uniref:Uncharacterized protein n=1 Tax=Strongylus vulgaris TaxID=40348 RepID=A0A3P7L166_STRVU|nr:unnamed protein product [Strongylus vulgaris]
MQSVVAAGPYDPEESIPEVASTVGNEFVTVSEQLLDENKENQGLISASEGLSLLCMLS